MFLFNQIEDATDYISESEEIVLRGFPAIEVSSYSLQESRK